MKRNLERFFGAKSLPLVLAVIAAGLAAPSIRTGWQQDDLVQRYFLLGKPDVNGDRRSPLDLFTFLDGNPARNQALMDAGALPWWTLPTLRISFWRPLSSLSHWLDYILWPESSVLMHLQSLLWFAALVVAAVILYRRMIGATWVAGLAALFFALDDAHGLAAGWLANRNALLAGFFGILALVVHHRWRGEGWKAGVILSPVLLLIALFSGESALAICGYLFAYSLFMDPGPRRERLMSLLPSTIVAGGWLICYTMLGHGTSGSGFYVDPISEPLRFLAAMAWKAPLLLADQWALPPSSIVIVLPDQSIPLLVLWALGVLALIAALIFPLVRHDRTARFWFTGMMLSIPLVCSTMPHSRLLTFAGIGAFGLLAQWLEGAWNNADWTGKSWRRTTRTMVVFFVFTHVLIAAVLLPLNATSAAFGQAFIQDAAAGVSAGSELQSQDLVILNHPFAFHAHHFQIARLLADQPSPRRLRVLASGTVPPRVYRPDERTLVIRPEGGFLAFPFDNVYRGSDFPLRQGEGIVLGGMTVEVMELTDDGRPATAAFRFPCRLEDPSLRWIRWEREGYVPFELPPVGETREIPASPPSF